MGLGRVKAPHLTPRTLRPFHALVLSPHLSSFRFSLLPCTPPLLFACPLDTDEMRGDWQPYPLLDEYAPLAIPAIAKNVALRRAGDRP